jgi:hypothetical protein
MHFACIRCGSATCEREDGSAHGQRGRTFTALAVRQSISKHLSRSWPSDFFFLGPVLSPEVSERKARTVSLRVHSVTGKILNMPPLGLQMRPAAGLPDKLTSLGTKRTRTSCGLLHNGTMHGYGSLRELLPASQQHCFSVSVQFLPKNSDASRLNVSHGIDDGPCAIDESPGEFSKNPWVEAIR